MHKSSNSPRKPSFMARVLKHTPGWQRCKRKSLWILCVAWLLEVLERFP